MSDNSMSPAEKRKATMIAKYGADYAQKIGKKASETMREKYTDEERAEFGRRGGLVGGKNSPNKFKVGDERAVRAGQKSRPYTRKPRPESDSEPSE